MDNYELQLVGDLNHVSGYDKYFFTFFILNKDKNEFIDKTIEFHFSGVAIRYYRRKKGIETRELRIDLWEICRDYFKANKDDIVKDSNNPTIKDLSPELNRYNT